MLYPFKTTQTLTDDEKAPQPQLKHVLEQWSAFIDRRRARRLRRQGFHQSYTSHPTPEQLAAVRRSQGERDGD